MQIWSWQLKNLLLQLLSNDKFCNKFQGGIRRSISLRSDRVTGRKLLRGMKGESKGKPWNIKPRFTESWGFWESVSLPPPPPPPPNYIPLNFTFLLFPSLPLSIERANACRRSLWDYRTPLKLVAFDRISVLKCLNSQWKLSSSLLKARNCLRSYNIDRCILQVLVNVASDTKHVKRKIKHVLVRICKCYFKVKLWSLAGEQFYFSQNLFKLSQ